MSSFETLFRQSKGQPVTYNGRTIALIDRFPVENGALIKLTFENFGSNWRQGVILRVDGSFEINGQKIKKSIVLWQNTAPKEVALQVTTKVGQIEVNNVWDTGDGCMQSWHNGAAMLVEEIPHGRRYRCNDGEPDDDFADIVFTIRTDGE